MIKVVVDTNSVNNSGLGSHFFGNRKILEELSKKFEICVPEIVIDEIKEHKRRSFNEQLCQLKKSSLLRACNGNNEWLTQVKSEDIIESDLKNEYIQYTIVPFSNKELYIENFLPLAIKNMPPFDKSTDRGIKDSVIAHCVNELLNGISSDEKIILVSDDARLKEYFRKNDKVVAVDRLDDVLPLVERKNGVVIKNDKKIEIAFSGMPEKTRRQIIVEKMLTNFRNSPCFKKTHELTAVLVKNEKLLTIEDKRDIIISTLNNNQISYIANDEDISDFLIRIYGDCKTILTREQKEDFEVLMGIRKRYNIDPANVDGSEELPSREAATYF